MTRSLIARRAFAAFVAGSALVLAACGGGGGDDSGGNAAWRVVNLTNDAASIDAFTGTDERFTDVTTAEVTDYAGITVGSYNVKITEKDSASSILASSFTFSPSRDKSYTAVVTGRKGSARIATLLDDEDTSGVAADTARVRIYNAAIDAGALDVYITTASDLTGLAPTVSSVAASTVGGFRDITGGDNYRLVVTAAGVQTDVRLDVTGLQLDPKVAYSVVLTAGTSGALVNATLVAQGGDVTPLTSSKARVRVVAGAADGGAVVASIQLGASSAVSISARSPSTGVYRLIDAGTYPVTVTLDGTQVSSASRTFAVGGDYTLVVAGTPAAPSVQFLADDNRLATAGGYRVRMVHADSRFDALTVTFNGATPIGLEAVDFGTTSASVTSVISASSYNVQVSTVSPITLLPTLAEQTIVSQGVYTLFVLGGAVNADTGAPVSTVVLRKDR